ncbi:hypothetical protein LOZ32_005300 [Ophidiomyces ophidiicola]|nr:hypothetical protein LOZ32_005300 [Ophidiomyces ophidiicola]
MESSIAYGFSHPEAVSGLHRAPMYTSPNHLDSDPSSSAHNETPKNSSPPGVASTTTTNTTATTTSSSSDPRVNVRSCVTCRRRKIRCNKIHPCSHCVKAKVDCVFPGAGRAPRKSKKATETELLARLKTLEAIVRSLSTSAPSEDLLAGKINDVSNETKVGEPDVSIFAEQPPKTGEVDAVGEEMGRLVVGDGKSRYVSHRFWTQFGDEIGELKDMIDCPTSDEDEYPSPGNSGPGQQSWDSNDGFLFGYWSIAHSLREFHLPSEKVGIIWETYVENVAPVVPIFHRPTLKKMLWDAAADLDSVSKSTEALLFTIYYTTITSMTTEQCLSQLGQDRDTALRRYRFAVEQALARANLLNTHSIVLLQSLVLFLICVRQDSDSRYVLSMAALAIQIGRGIGLHRDGAAFGLTPFETDMRRRLWLQLCLIDFCSAEDHGCDPMIYEASYDTLPPLNINDEDISPDSKEYPPERVGCTDVTFILFRCDIVKLSRRLTHVPPSSLSKEFKSYTQAEREELVRELGRHLERKYVQYCDMSIPIQWVCGTMSRLVVAKLVLMVHHPMTQERTVELAPGEAAQNCLFCSSIEIIEFALLLETNDNTSKWRWFFRTHMQWHALAYVLSNLCVRAGPCPVVDRAWRAVNAAYKAWEIKGQQKKGMLWPGIRKLMARALQAREARLEQLSRRLEEKPAFTGDVPPHCDMFANPTPLDTFSTQPPVPQALAIPNGIPMEPVVNASFTPNTENYSSDSIDVPMLSGSFFPQENLYNGDMVNLSQVMISPPPSWDEWNQVVRDFQHDIRNDDLSTANVWF